MAECSEIEAGGEIRTIKDTTARNALTVYTDTQSNSFPVYWRQWGNTMECWGVIPAGTSVVNFPKAYSLIPALSLDAYQPYLGTGHAIISDVTVTQFTPRDGQYSAAAGSATRSDMGFRAIGVCLV